MTIYTVTVNGSLLARFACKPSERYERVNYYLSRAGLKPGTPFVLREERYSY